MKHSAWYIVGGIVALIGGILALANPFASSLAATALAGYIFLIAGAFQLFGAFTPHDHASRWYHAILGVMGLLLGFWLLLDPFTGLLSLTLAVAILLIISGGLRAFAAFSYTGPARWLLGLSALVAIGLGVLILIAYPASALAVLGLYLGVELIFVGVALITAGIMGRDPLAAAPPG